MSDQLLSPAHAFQAQPLLLKYLLPAPGTATAPIVSGGSRFTYEELRSRIERLGAALTALGIASGSAVAVMGWDDHRYLECYFAIPMLGATIQTINVRFSPDAIVAAIEQSHAAVLIHHPDFAPIAALVKSRCPGIQLVEAGDSTPSADALGYEDMLSGQDTPFAFPDFNENSIATMFHTSGTTGTPRLVRFSHRQLVLHTLSVAAALGQQPAGQGFGPGDVYMPLTPLFHVHAWGMPFIATMFGAKQVYPGRYEAQRILALQREEGVTFTHCIPTILQMVLAARSPDEPKFQNWKIVIGGAPLSEALATEAVQAGIQTIGGYGMSESGPVISIARSVSNDPAELRRAGRPMPLVRTRLANAKADVGQLQLQAPWLTQGTDPPGELWRDGWMQTQDVARILPCGSLEIVDRVSDSIKSGGEWISSLALEEILTQMPGVASAAVVKETDLKWGERPVAFVVMALGQSANEETLRTAMETAVSKGVIPRYAVPDRYFILEEMPMTGAGKIDKQALRSKLA